MTADLEETCMILDAVHSYSQAEPRLSSLEAVVGSTMPPTFESSGDSEDEEGEIKEEKMVAHPAVHPSVIRARQILQPPAIRDTPQNLEPFPNIQLSLPPSFVITVMHLIAIK